MDNVFLSRCEEYDKEKVEKSIHDILEFFGGAAALAGGKKVLIKANLLMASTPDMAVTTHPTVIAAIAKEFKAAGCEVMIADSCGGIYTKNVLEKLYAVSGMKMAAEESGAELNYDTSSFEREFKDGAKLKKAQLISPIEWADFIVTAAKLKTHGFAYYTGAVKNLYGTIPGLNKAVLHSRFPDKKDFCELLVDICESVAPDFAIIDGVEGMEGAGPSAGEKKKANVIIGAKSPYAADEAAIKIMGLAPENSYTHMTARARGLVSEVSFHGEAIESLVCSFKPPYEKETHSVLQILPKSARTYVGRIFAAYPEIDSSKCIGCGVCVRSCPEKTIVIKDGKAKVVKKKCIRCYCCHELCQEKAVELKRLFKRK